MQEKLYLYYTNDLHSNFSKWPQVTNLFKDEKAKRLNNHQAAWFMDVGDHIDRVHPITEASMGQANVELMNDIGYDIITLGNNEGITLSHNDLYHLYDNANFQVVCANLQSLSEKEPDWLESTVHVESESGIKVGVIGLTVPFNNFYELLNWHVASPYSTLNNHLDRLRETADIIVLISHLGISEDQKIAEQFTDIDVIIGGHTHHLLRNGETINNTLITAAGKHNKFTGEVELTWDHTQGCLVNKTATVHDMSERPSDIETEQKLNKLMQQADTILEQPIIHLNNPIEIRWFKNTPIMQKLTDTLREWTDADIGMLNAGVLMDQIPSGSATHKDIHRICPHPINPCVVELTGSELESVIQSSLSRQFTELKLKGFGFRGEILGEMIYSNIEIHTAVKEDGAEYANIITYQGESLEPEKMYYIATADTFTFGSLLPEIANARQKHYYLPEFLRDLLTHTLQHKISCNS